MSASPEHVSEEHTSIEHLMEVEPHIRAASTRIGTLFLVLSDTMLMIAILSSGGYLSLLNVMGQFKVPGESAPPFLPGFVVVILLVLSGLSYFMGERNIRRNGVVGQKTFFILAVLLMALAILAQIWVYATLGYSGQLHAYASMMYLIQGFSSFHIVTTAFLGVLLLGRMAHGRLGYNAYIVTAVGYWWYYIAIAGVVIWAVSLLIK